MKLGHKPWTAPKNKASCSSRNIPCTQEFKTPRKWKTKSSACAHCEESFEPHSTKTRPTVPPEHTVSSDTVGSITPPSKHRNRHILIFSEYISRYAIEMPILPWDEVWFIIPTILNGIQNIFKTIISGYYDSDNDKELLGHWVNTLHKKWNYGTKQTTTIPHHPKTFHRWAVELNTHERSSSPSSMLHNNEGIVGHECHRRNFKMWQNFTFLYEKTIPNMEIIKTYHCIYYHLVKMELLQTDPQKHSKSQPERTAHASNGYLRHQDIKPKK